MPGIPTSRACDACRKCRKRCDQIQPTCSRCERRGLSCIGGGSQRFIFKIHDTSRLNLYKAKQSGTAISQMPSSASTKLSMSLVNKLETRHLRFEINWAHGSFMDGLPRRIGHSEALATATEAFMLAIPCADVSYTLSRRRLRSYTAALTATRLALLNPDEAYSLNTLCSVYLLWICQSWLAMPDDRGVHPKGLSMLLNQPIRFDSLDPFDRGVVYVACTVVTAEKVVTGKANIDANSRCWTFFNVVNARTATIRFTQPTGECLALTQRLSRLLSALATFLRSKQTFSEVWTLYGSAKTVIADLSARIKQSNNLTPHARLGDLQDCTGAKPELFAVDERDLRCFKLALTFTLIFNGILSTHYPNCDNLAEFRQRFTNILPSKVEQLMPMGVGFMGQFLSNAWAIEDETTASQAAWDIYGTESATRRSNAFSQKLESTLELLL